jgi:hypothetical protein
MKNKKLWALKFISWLLIIAGVVLPFVAYLEGKKPEMWPVFILFAGVIGLYSHDILLSLHERISKLENRKD